jgi:hypothetical protein
MTTGDDCYEDFIEALKNLKDEPEKLPEQPKKPKPQVELTNDQKRIIVQYMLGGVSKGLFEDCEDFWEGMSQEQIDELYPAYADESERFVDELKQHILDTLGV